METLAEQMAVFRAAADASYDWEEWVDIEGHIRYISPACKRITGYGPEEFLANPHLAEDIIHPADRSQFTSYINRVIANPNDAQEIEYRILHRNGEVRWVELGNQPVFDSKGLSLGRRVSYRDITKHKQIEEELRQSHQIIQALLQAATDAITVIDSAGNVLLCNTELSLRIGKDNDEIGNTNLWTVFPPEVVEFRKKTVDQAFQTGQPVRTEDRGSITNIIYDTIVYPIPNEEGKVDRVAIWARDITERKKAEEELRSQHQLLEALLDGLNEVVAVIDLDGTILLGNKVLTRQLGKDLEELIGKYSWGMFPEDLTRKRRKIFNQVVQTGQPVRFEDQGIAGIYNSIFYPVKDEHGKVKKVAILSYDITELKRNEQALRESEEKYRFLAENSNDVIWRTDKRLRPIFFSPSIEKLRGYSVDEALHEPFENTLTNSSLEKARALLHAVPIDERNGIEEMELQKPIQLEYTCKDGSTVWTESSISVVRDSKGKLIGFMGVTRDITERKKAEEALQRSEQLLREVIQSIPVIIAVMDDQGVIKLAEGKGFDSTGYQASDLLGKNIQDLSKYPEEMGHRLQRVMAGEEFMELDRESILGAVFETHYIPMQDDRSNVVGIITVSIDVTDYWRVQDELRQSKNQLEVILNGVQDSIVVLDAQGRLIFVNQASSRRIGYESSEAMLEDDGLYNAFDYFDEAGEPLSDYQLPGRLAQKGIPQAGKIYRYRIKRGGSERWVVISETPVFDETGKVEMAVLIAHDISELKFTQKELQKAREELEQRVEERTLELVKANQQLRDEVELRKRYEMTIRQKAAHSEALARVAASINSQLDLKSLLQTICDETASAINYPGCAIMLFYEERDCFDVVANTLGFIVGRVASISREQYEGFLEAFGPVIVIPDISILPNVPYTEIAAIRQARTIVSVPLNYDGTLVGNLCIYSLGEIHLPTEDERNLLVSFAHQASIAIAKARLFEQTSESQRRLQALSERLVRIQEEERRTLARELHDEIGQMLTSLSLNCGLISRMLREDEADLMQISTQFDRSRQIVNHLLTQVRNLSLELRPGVLDDLGLLPALLDHFERYSSQTNIKVQFKHHGLEGRYSPDVETSAFRIVQEALTNTARHAKVDHVAVYLWVDQGFLRLKVEDQGVGFDLEAIEKTNSAVGITGMRERAIRCGGDLEIETIQGKGTCLTAELPLFKDPTWSENAYHDTAGR
jgi:PAS domain S-box-containing protein